jgi:predicted  nucleic acid-binding Zn-ribbon protein
MQQELVSLARRISELEDTELEVMERLENAQQEQKRLQDRLEEIDARAAELTASRDAKAGELTAQTASATDQRKVAVQDVPADLLALYEKIRAQKGGVGAAALVRRRCTGCSLDLTAADLGAIAKAPLDEVQRCEECDRILVRTSESGV